VFIFCFPVAKGFVPESCLEPLQQRVHSASPTGVPSCSSNNVPLPKAFKQDGQRKSEARKYSPTARLLEPPPPSYEDAVSSAESSPRLGRSRTSAASEHEYYSIDESETDGRATKETPESNVSKVTLINYRHMQVH